MTELLFGGAAFILIGYLIGKLFVRLNPFFVFIGFFLLLNVWGAISGIEEKNLATAFFVLGVILNFNRPVTYLRYLLSDAIGAVRLRKLSQGYTSNLEEQKEEFERDLYEQKHKVEKELKRQKYEAQQDIERQRREAEEALKREAENLRRERERYSREQQSNQQNQSNKQSQYNNQSSSSQSSSSKIHLNPLIFADACEILGLSQGKTLKEYKAAYLKLMKLYHSDKLAGLSEELRKQEEEKAKILNVAWGTIKKKLR